MQNVLRFWYLQSPRWIYDRLIAAIRGLDGQLAVADTWKNITKPIFQDYTRQGRIIGFFLRIFRILFSLVLYAFTALVYGVGYIFWLLFPFICLAWIIGSFSAAKI